MKPYTYRCARPAAWLLAIAAMAALPGCEQATRPAQPTGGTPAAHSAEGRATAAALQARFDAIDDNDPLNAECDGVHSPVFLCSGILLRATSAFNIEHHAWNPDRENPKPGGVSFSYLRRDASFDTLAHGFDNGFTVWPIFHLPAGKFEMEVLCYFPTVAGTDERSDAGCGKHAGHQDSGPCQDKDPPIVTGVAWLADYNKAPEGVSKPDQSCGFRMVTGTPDSAHVFDEAMHVVQLGRGAFFDTPDEAIIASWEENLEATIPLESFFYIAGTTGANHAALNQLDFYNTSQQLWRPVIRVTLPEAINGPATFEFRDEDQRVP